MAESKNQMDDVPGAHAEGSGRGPGGSWPNRSVVTSEGGRRALGAIVEVAGLGNKWTGLTEAEDRVRRAVLDLYARSGHAPAVARLAESTGMASEEVRTQLGELRKRDLIVLDEADAEIAGAYPFTERATGHRVRVGGRLLNAMCAIDALGVGAMYRTDVVIDSFCLHCDAGIQVSTGKGGAALERFSPPGTVVWAGLQYADQCSATSLCTVLAFFCSDEHLRSWRGVNPGANGFRLSLEEALQVGRAIFMNLLAPASSKG